MYVKEKEIKKSENIFIKTGEKEEYGDSDNEDGLEGIERKIEKTTKIKTSFKPTITDDTTPRESITSLRQK